MAVRNIINEFDPCALIGHGAPINEYDCLTFPVLEALSISKSQDEIKDIILSELELNFGIGVPEKEPYKTGFMNGLESASLSLSLLDEVVISRQHTQRED